jgi:iron complex transport system ATP-binding protein
MESTEDRQAVEEALEKTCLLHLRHKQLANLSGGEQQRATMALALAQKPEFMLLDEPASHLDFRHQLELADMLKHLKAEGLGIAIVLHDLNLMSRLADKILLLNKPKDDPSKIVASGAPDAVLTADNLRTVYQINISIADDPQTGKKIYSPNSLAIAD